MGILSFGPADERAQAQLQRCLDASGDSAQGVLCADHHPGYGMPIGGVVASQTHVLPAGVGFDIACGNMAVRTDITASHVHIPTLMDEIWNVLSFGVGQKNNEKVVHHPVYDLIQSSPVKTQRNLVQMAANQLGTIGSGNHYVDIFEECNTGLLWIGVHFGSRGFGHKTASYFLEKAAADAGHAYSDGMDAAPDAILIGSSLGDDYLAAMEIAGAYAYAGREWVVRRILSILGVVPTFTVHNHHNFAWWETSADGGRWLVTRKGATPARPGQQGFIGATMLDHAVVVEGVESELGADAFYSTVHGAGRVMGRREAAGVVKFRKDWVCGSRECQFHAPINAFRRGPDKSLPRCPACDTRLHEGGHQEVHREGRVNWPLWQGTVAAAGIELRGAGADEAPPCYKKLTEVLDHHAGTIRILHTLRPIGVAMAGKDTHDPYKD